MEVAAVGEVNHLPITKPLRKSGRDLTELEHRQVAILSRIADLYGSLDSLKCEFVKLQDSSGENAAGHRVPFSCACARGSAGAFPENHRGDDDEVGNEHLRELGGEKVLQNRNGVICPTSRSQVICDCGVQCERCERPQCGNGSSEQDVDVEKKLTGVLREAGAEFRFKRVPSDYYGRSFEERRDLLGAASVDHLCKSIVMVNTQALESVVDCSDRKNSKYYVIVVQYTARLNAEKVRQFVYSLNNGTIPKKRFNLRLAPEEESNRLTGFEHNAVTPFGMRTDIPVVLSDAIVKLDPEFFWLGGGEVDLKLGVRTSDFVKMINPFVVDCIY